LLVYRTEVRGQAATMLGTIGAALTPLEAPQAVAPLVKISSDENWAVRPKAAAALARWAIRPDRNVAPRSRSVSMTRAAKCGLRLPRLWARSRRRACGRPRGHRHQAGRHAAGLFRHCSGSGEGWSCCAKAGPAAAKAAPAAAKAAPAATKLLRLPQRLLPLSSRSLRRRLRLLRRLRLPPSTRRPTSCPRLRPRPPRWARC